MWGSIVFFFQAEDGIRDIGVTGVQTCALPISLPTAPPSFWSRLTPVEGWTIVLLHALLTLLAGWAVERAEWAPWLDRVAWVAPLGALFGLILAKCRVPDLLAHLLATGWGILLAVRITAGRAPH